MLLSITQWRCSELVAQNAGSTVSIVPGFLDAHEFDASETWRQGVRMKSDEPKLISWRRINSADSTDTGLCIVGPDGLTRCTPDDDMVEPLVPPFSFCGGLVRKYLASGPLVWDDDEPQVPRQGEGEASA
ncbi:MAG: hypothetical protein IV093_15080 [Rubrivivax sp.]|nr:hypothetical protein [Rubrivivax sp.]